jgi:hypothetical protein
MMLALLSQLCGLVCACAAAAAAASFAFLSFARVHFPAAVHLTIRRPRAQVNSRIKSKETIEQSGVECGCKEM